MAQGLCHRLESSVPQAPICKDIHPMKKSFRFLSLLTALGLSCVASQAQVLMLDFGPTLVSGSDLANSPYNAANPSFTGTTWNQIGTADVSSLTFANGSAATGLTLNIGATTSATTFSSTLVLTNVPSGNSALGTLTSAGIYAGTSVGTDGIFTSSSGNSRAVGFQLSGLGAGTYDVYVTARNTSSNANYTQTAFVGSSASAGNFALNGAGMTSETLTFANASVFTSSWIEDSNYLKFTVTLGAGDVLNLATLGGGGEVRGFLNSVQIVAVPEPAISVMLGLSGVLYCFRRRAGRVTV